MPRRSKDSTGSATNPHRVVFTDAEAHGPHVFGPRVRQSPLVPYLSGLPVNIGGQRVRRPVSVGVTVTFTVPADQLPKWDPEYKPDDEGNVHISRVLNRQELISKLQRGVPIERILEESKRYEEGQIGHVYGIDIRE